ncbi:3D domain-containing protein [Sporosarcina sp. ITBMC105]
MVAAKQAAQERRRLDAIKAAEAEVRRKQAQAKPQVSRSKAYVGQAQLFTATAYTAYCSGCSGITADGHDLRKSIYKDGRRVIATDPRLLPLGSVVRVTLADGTSFEAVSADTGGAIKGAIIDIAHETREEALKFGRQDVKVSVIRRGK